MGKHEVLCLDPRFNKSNTPFCKHKKLCHIVLLTSSYELLGNTKICFIIWLFHKIFVKPGHKTKFYVRGWSILKGGHQVFVF